MLGRRVFRAGHGQVHLRHRSIRARQCRGGSGAFQRGPDDLGGLARRRIRHLLHRRPGLHGGLGDPLAGEPSGSSAAQSELDAIAAADAGGVMCVPALAGLGAPWWQPQAHGGRLRDDPVDRPRAHRARGPAGHRRSDRGAGRRDRGRHRVTLRAACASTAGSPVRRVLMQATADILGVPIDVYPSAHATALGAAALARAEPAARHRRCATSVTPWTPSGIYEPRWRPHRAAEFRSAWRGSRCRDVRGPGDASMTRRTTSSSSVRASSARAIARELTGYDLTIAVLEARDDVGDGTSKANTAILHTGFDAKPGTLESRVGSPRVPPAVGLRRCARASRSSAPGRSWWRGIANSSTPCPRCGTRPRPTATTPAR